MLNDPGALITRKITWDGYVLFKLKSRRVARRAKPGQFLMVRVSSQPYPLLRRPLSIHSREKDGVEVFFARSGLGTAILADKKPGETLDILGPLGKGFVIPAAPKGKIFYLVGGGRGIAPLYFLARELQAKGGLTQVFYGGKSEADVPLVRKLTALKIEVFISTDDGSAGFRGLVTSMFEKELARSARPAHVYACGPDPMMKKVAGIAAGLGVPAQVSLESIMGCGIGACWGCVRKMRGSGGAEWVKVCEDGPVFSASKVIWDEDR
jgi:dihydroorotate dehydrogenase electron transfer subunit